jgi:tetratricopeptide (TPR) repeat protein
MVRAGMADEFQQAIEAHRRGDYETALRGYAALSTFKNARHNLGALLSQLGRLEEAEAAFRPILAHYPDFAPAQFSLSMVLLAQARYAEGWAMFEARRLAGHVSVIDPDSGVPEWRGEELRGRRIVVCAEQGYGDQLMFARYLPLLRERGAEVVVGCNALMRPLFASLGYAVTAYPGQDRRIPACDYWVQVCSLPLRLGLAAPPPPLAFAARRLGGGVGVVPTGDPRHVNDHNRSLPPDLAARLLALGRDLRPEATGTRDFREAAELFAGLDLVITVDTAAAHLAGSLGVPTWVLLPAFGVDWRWLRGVAASPWYPSVRLFRQPAPGDWTSVFAEVATALDLPRG